MFKKTEEENSDFWISYTDLITGFMIIFVVLSFWLFSQNSKNSKTEGKYKQLYQEIKDSLNKSTNKNVKGKYEALVKEFREKFKNEKDIVVSNDGAIRFLSPNDILFENNSTQLTAHFRNLLNNFLHKYLAIIYEIYERQKQDRVFIKEIRIEGHASSEGGKDYIYNLELSNGRALEVYKYLFNSIANKTIAQNYKEDFKRFLPKNTLSCGYSFANPLDKNGRPTDEKNENYAQSRRVEFRIILEYK
ncbi:MAG: hypothetical protein EAZ55_03435 [Cytophagales bacterium]|nr:MAG: hypothetical protein EAZ55_03435 [Cytophagales bacterium]